MDGHMPASGTASVGLIDDVIADGSNRMNFEVYRALLSAQIQSNAVKKKEQTINQGQSPHPNPIDLQIRSN